jgi:hydrogenase nickel incorporation protein HypA/HybF
MHELSVTENILEVVLRHAQEADARQVVNIHLVIGQLASIVDDSVQFYWDMIAKDTIAEQACLHFRRIPAEFECLDCGHRFRLGDGDWLCPHCGSAQLTIIAGEEFFIESIDIET